MKPNIKLRLVILSIFVLITCAVTQTTVRWATAKATISLIFGTGGILEWTSNADPSLGSIDTGLSRCAADVLCGGNGTAGDKSGTIKLTTLTVNKSDGTVPATINNDGIGGFSLTPNGSTAWTFATNGILFPPPGKGIGFQGATSGATTLIPSAVATGTLTLPAATDQLVGQQTPDTLTNKTLGGAGSTTPNTNFNRLRANQGSAVVAGNFSITGGASWGSTASISSVSGTDSIFTISIASAGTGQAANAGFSLTFHDGAFPSVPKSICGRNEANAPGGVSLPTTNTTTTSGMTFNGLPVAGTTYSFTCFVIETL